MDNLRSAAGRGTRDVMRVTVRLFLLQFRVLRLGLLQDGGATKPDNFHLVLARVPKTPASERL